MNTAVKVVGTIAGMALSALAGGTYISYKNLKNTPEDVIRRMNEATEEAKKAKKEADGARALAAATKIALENKKKEYQDEIRPDIEKAIRAELNNYIERADVVYEKAKHEKELAELKLELAEAKCQSQGLTFSFGGGTN